jgi:hypothetical protein
MGSTASITQRITLAVALLGVIGIAYADGSSLSRFGGDGYAYFSQQMPIVNKARSEFRKDNPKGLPESYHQEVSSGGDQNGSPPPTSTDRERHYARAVQTEYRSVTIRRCRPIRRDGSLLARRPVRPPFRIATPSPK